MLYNNIKNDAQKKLKDTFMDLYAIKPLKNITVKEITSKAGLNRSTFYSYYNDIYALLEDIENGLIEDILPNIDIFLLVVNNQEDISQLITRINQYKKYQPYLKALLGENVSNSFVNKIKTAIKKHMIIKLNIKDHNNSITDYIMEYIVSAHFGIVTYWLKRDMDISVEKIIELLRTTFTNGPYKVLKNDINILE